MNDKPRGPGRPPKAANSRVGNLTFRIHDTVRSHLARSAEITGRTLTEEVEDRVQRSVRVEEEAFGGPETYALMLGMAARLRTYERRFGKPWIEIEDVRFHRAAGRAFEHQIAVCQADLGMRPFNANDRQLADSPDPQLLTPEELAARGIEIIENPDPNEWKSEDDWEMPPDPDVSDPSTPIMVPLPRQEASAKPVKERRKTKG